MGIILLGILGIFSLFIIVLIIEGVKGHLKSLPEELKQPIPSIYDAFDANWALGATANAPVSQMATMNQNLTQINDRLANLENKK